MFFAATVSGSRHLQKIQRNSLIIPGSELKKSSVRFGLNLELEWDPYPHHWCTWLLNRFWSFKMTFSIVCTVRRHILTYRETNHLPIRLYISNSQTQGSSGLLHAIVWTFFVNLVMFNGKSSTTCALWWACICSSSPLQVQNREPARSCDKCVKEYSKFKFKYSLN